MLLLLDGRGGGPPAGGDVTREVKGHPFITYLGSLKAVLFPFFGHCQRTNLSFLQFSLVRQESDRLHTKRLKIAK